MQNNRNKENNRKFDEKLLLHDNSNVPNGMFARFADIIFNIM